MTLCSSSFSFYFLWLTLCFSLTFFIDYLCLHRLAVFFIFLYQKFSLNIYSKFTFSVFKFTFIFTFEVFSSIVWRVWTRIWVFIIMVHTFISITWRLLFYHYLFSFWLLSLYMLLRVWNMLILCWLFRWFLLFFFKCYMLTSLFILSPWSFAGLSFWFHIMHELILMKWIAVKEIRIQMVTGITWV